MQGCQRARYVLSIFSNSAAISLPPNPHDAEVTFCLHYAFSIIAQSAIATFIISGLCVRHYRTANWWDNESEEFERFGNESSYLSLKIWSPKNLSFVYVGTCMQSYSSLHTQLCVSVCVYPILNVLWTLCYSAELSLHTNIETQSKTSFLSSVFANSFMITLTQQLDKTQQQHSKITLTRCRCSASYTQRLNTTVRCNPQVLQHKLQLPPNPLSYQCNHH